MMTATVIILVTVIYALVFFQACVVSMARKEILYLLRFHKKKLNKTDILKGANWTVRQSTIDKHLRVLEIEGLIKRTTVNNGAVIYRYWSAVE